ncbi:glycine cleavage system H-protein subunit [Elasticomyces elasticus]|nr:glycine cleavage system H-protein subunit [Elasticomyces elasticus]
MSIKVPVVMLVRSFTCRQVPVGFSCVPRRGLSGRSLRFAPNQQWQRAFSARAAAWEKKYTQDHEWIELSSDGKTGTIGISTYAATALGDVVYVELPQIDTELGAGDALGAVESVKSASDILTPVSGKVIKVNEVLEETPATINKSPEGDGWIAQIEIADEGDMNGLMSASEYKDFTEKAEGD